MKARRIRHTLSAEFNIRPIYEPIAIQIVRGPVP